jgi:hypothetical protein
MSHAPNLEEMPSLVRGLSSASPPEREAAAREIFCRGSELARAASQKWMADAELSGTFVLSDGRFPETTVGVAVEPETFESIRAANDAARLADVPPDQDAKEFELRFGPEVRLDILTTQQPGGKGAIARYLQKFGEGIQQIELLTRDVDRASEILRARFGLEPLYPATRSGADGSRVNFFLVPGPTGKKVLVELVEAGR